MGTPKNMKYYDTLGVTRTFTESELKKAYRNLCKIYHPDVADNNEDAEFFKEIKEAYETLIDPEKRKKYDLTGESPKGERGIEERLAGFFNTEILPLLIDHNTTKEIARTDITDQMNDIINNKVNFHKEEFKTVSVVLAKYEQLLSRISTTAPNDIIIESWKSQRENVKEQIESIQSDLDFLVIAKERLKTFDYEFERWT